MRPALIDDQILSSVLRDKAPKQIARRELHTTGYWYVRLCQAVLGRDLADRSLSRPFGALPPHLRSRAEMALLELPPEIGLLSLRELGPGIGILRRTFSLNALGIEALAAAQRLDADVFLATPSPVLESALIALSLRARLLIVR